MDADICNAYNFHVPSNLLFDFSTTETCKTKPGSQWDLDWIVGHPVVQRTSRGVIRFGRSACFCPQAAWTIPRVTLLGWGWQPSASRSLGRGELPSVPWLTSVGTRDGLCCIPGTIASHTASQPGWQSPATAFHVTPATEGLTLHSVKSVFVCYPSLWQTRSWWNVWLQLNLLRINYFFPLQLLF